LGYVKTLARVGNTHGEATRQETEAMPSNAMFPPEPEEPERHVGGRSNKRSRQADKHHMAVLAAAAEEAEELLSSGGVSEPVLSEAERRIKLFLDVTGIA
jgi:hypothetical protein